MPKSIEPFTAKAEATTTTSHRAAPVFVPRRFPSRSRSELTHTTSDQRNLGNSRFKTKEIRLDPGALPNGLGHGGSSRKPSTINGSRTPGHASSVVPTPTSLIPVSVEVHPHPGHRQGPDETTMTVFSIFGKKPTPGVKANGQPPVPNGYLGNGSANSSYRELESIAEENKSARISLEETDLDGKTPSSKSQNNHSKAPDNYSESEVIQIEQNSTTDMSRRPSSKKRRRSSLLSGLDNFFKVRVAEKPGGATRPNSSSVGGPSGYLMSHGRASVASRMSFSSEYGSDLRVTNFNRMTDLRKMLREEEEPQDLVKSFCDSFASCECFEWNLNNAAKLITLVVIILTFIMVIKALTNF